MKRLDVVSAPYCAYIMQCLTPSSWHTSGVLRVQHGRQPLLTELSAYGRVYTYTAPFTALPVTRTDDNTITILHHLGLNRHLSASSNSLFPDRVSSVGAGTRYSLYGPGIESQWRARFSATAQTGPGAHPASYTIGTGSFLGVKRPGRGADHPPPSSVGVKERVELYMCSPLWAFVDCCRELAVYSKAFQVVFVHLVYNSALYLASCCCSFLLHVVANLFGISLISHQLVVFTTLPKFLNFFCCQKGCTRLFFCKISSRIKQIFFLSLFLIVQISLP